MRYLFKLIMYGIVSASLIVGFSACSDSDSTPAPVTPDPIPVPGEVSFGVGDYPNANLLVSGGALEAAISESAEFVLIDARSGTLPDTNDATYGQHPYIQGHIPGAIGLSHEDFGMPLNSVSQLENILTGKGISRDMTIIIYDDTTASWGAAGRLFWMFEYLGCEDVHILHGGWDLWVADGRATETIVNTLPAAEAFVAQINTDILATKEHVRDRLDDSDFVLIDSRTDEEFNGWTLYGEARGGHISGTAQISYKHFFYDNKTVLMYEDLIELFEDRGITSDKEVVSYCTAGVRSGFAYFALRLLGYTNCSNYDGSIYEWAVASVADPDTYPMDQMANYQVLVYAQWVKDLIDDKNPPTYPGNGYVILYPDWYARYYEDRTDYVGTPYEDGHIHGAIFVDIYSLENGPSSQYGDQYEHPYDSNIKPIPELQEFLGKMGITKDTTVVVYGDADQGMSTAARTAWALLIAGVDDVRLLNGGYEAWLEIGGEVDTLPHPWVPASFGIDEGNPQYLASMDDVREVVDGTVTGVDIVDDRRWNEYIGAENKYVFMDTLGRIATAKWIGNSSKLVRSDGLSLETYTEVLSNWKEEGFTSDRKMYFYCGTGWRSGLYTFYAYAMDWPAANFDGGWYEWSWYPENPIETGIPE